MPKARHRPCLDPVGFADVDLSPTPARAGHSPTHNSAYSAHSPQLFASHCSVSTAGLLGRRPTCKASVAADPKAAPASAATDRFENPGASYAQPLKALGRW